MRFLSDVCATYRRRFSFKIIIRNLLPSYLMGIRMRLGGTEESSIGASVRLSRGSRECSHGFRLGPAFAGGVCRCSLAATRAIQAVLQLFWRTLAVSSWVVLVTQCSA